MKKKRIVYLICGVLIIGIGCILICFGRLTTNGTLIVNNKEITSENIKIHRSLQIDYAELPLTEVLNALGFDIEWLDNNTAKMVYNDEKYILNLAEVSFIKESENFNLIRIPPGSRIYYYKALDRELILDSDTIYWLMSDAKRRIKINIDHDKSVIYITD